MLPAEPDKGLLVEPESGCGEPPTRLPDPATLPANRGTVMEPNPLGGGEKQLGARRRRDSERLRDIGGTGGVENLGGIGGVDANIGAATTLPPGDPT